MRSRIRSLPVLALSLVVGFLGACKTVSSSRPPLGKKIKVSGDQLRARKAMGARAGGIVVWSSSRRGYHDIFIMNTDGTEQRGLTDSRNTDWYPRLSPNGMWVLFMRSKEGWAPESDAGKPNTWDIFMVSVRGGQPQPLIRDGAWGNWVSDGEISFVRGNKLFMANIGSGEARVLVDAKDIPAFGGKQLENPQMSPDRFYVAMTLVGANSKEVGILNLGTNKWLPLGPGEGVTWFPAGDRVAWIAPSGQDGHEVLSAPVRDGVPAPASAAEKRMLDIGGKRSVELFCKTDQTGKWLVLGAAMGGEKAITASGIGDYELFLWPVGGTARQAVRLTFHSANDRWPDLRTP